MTRHIADSEVMRFLKGELSVDELMFVDDHLATCETCRKKAAREPALVRATDSFEAVVYSRSMVDDNHLIYQDLEAYADNKLKNGDRERVSAHLALCDECLAEAEELRSLGNANGIPSAAASNADGRGKREPIWRWFSLSGLRIVTACIAVAVAVAIAWLVCRPADGTNQEGAADQRNVYPRVERGPESPDQAQPNTASGEQVGNAGQSGNYDTRPKELRSALVDGGPTIGIDETGRLVGYGDIATKYRESLTKALETGNVVVSPNVRDLRSASGATMGEAAGGTPFRVFGPKGKLIASDTPVFKWQALDGAESYRLEVYDAGFKKVADSGPLKKTSWAARLPRGKMYTWQVVALKGGKEFRSPVRPQPDAQFKIVGSAELAEIETIKRQFPKSKLLPGVLYAQAGLLDEAAAEFEALLRQNPKSGQVRRLLHSVRTQQAQFR